MPAHRDREFRELFGSSLDEVVALPWQHKRLFSVRQVQVLLKMQLRGCVRRGYEALVLGQLIAVIEATPSLTRAQVRMAFEHIQETPGLPPLESDASVFFPLHDWLYGCPNAVLKALAPDDAASIDDAVPVERHLRLVEPARW